METGSGITGWSKACIGEMARHENEAGDYRAIYGYYSRVCDSMEGLHRKRFIFLYKNGERLGGVIGAPSYVVDLHRRMRSREIPSTLCIMRPREAA